MYQVEYDGKLLAPILEAEDALYWAERIGKLIPRRSAQIILTHNDKDDVCYKIHPKRGECGYRARWHGPDGECPTDEAQAEEFYALNMEVSGE